MAERGDSAVDEATQALKKLDTGSPSGPASRASSPGGCVCCNQNGMVRGPRAVRGLCSGLGSGCCVVDGAAADGGAALLPPHCSMANVHQTLLQMKQAEINAAMASLASLGALNQVLQANNVALSEEVQRNDAALQQQGAELAQLRARLAALERDHTMGRVPSGDSAHQP